MCRHEMGWAKFSAAGKATNARLLPCKRADGTVRGFVLLLLQEGFQFSNALHRLGIGAHRFASHRIETVVAVGSTVGTMYDKLHRCATRTNSEASGGDQSACVTFDTDGSKVIRQQTNGGKQPAWNVERDRVLVRGPLALYACNASNRDGRYHRHSTPSVCAPFSVSCYIVGMRDTVVARVLPTCRLHCGSDLRVRLIELQLVANIIFRVNCSCARARVCMCALLSLHRSGIVAQNIEPSPLRRAARHDER